MQAEEQIMVRLQAGDGQAYRKIFESYYLPLRSYACRYVAEDMVAEDMVQDAFLLAWERRGDFKALLALKHFLYVTVKNACLNYLKHLAVEERNMEALSLHLEGEREEDAMLEEEVHAEIYRAVRELSEQARQVVIATMEGASNEEIAEKLQISINSVKTVKQRAYKVLRRRLSRVVCVLLLFS